MLATHLNSFKTLGGQENTSVSQTQPLSHLFTVSRVEYIEFL